MEEPSQTWQKKRLEQWPLSTVHMYVREPICHRFSHYQSSLCLRVLGYGSRDTERDRYTDAKVEISKRKRPEKPLDDLEGHNTQGCPSRGHSLGQNVWPTRGLVAQSSATGVTVAATPPCSAIRFRNPKVPRYPPPARRAPCLLRTRAKVRQGNPEKGATP